MMFRYGLSPTALLQLAGDLSSSDSSSRLRALRGLSSDFRIRELIQLVNTAVRIADELIAAGTYRDDPVQLEQFRPIAAVLPRVRELCLDPDPRVAKMAALALAKFDAPPPSYARERLGEWLRLPGFAVGVLMPAALGLLLSLMLGGPFWIIFAATAGIVIALTEGLFYWTIGRATASAPSLNKE